MGSLSAMKLISISWLLERARSREYSLEGFNIFGCIDPFFNLFYFISMAIFSLWHACGGMKLSRIESEYPINFEILGARTRVGISIISLSIRGCVTHDLEYL